MAGMKKSKILTKNSPRVLFFDILRILAIAIIVYAHSQFFFAPEFNALFFSDGQNFFNIYYGGITRLAVYCIFLVSGAVLALSYKEITTLQQYRSFILRRIIRIYPAFWLSLLLGLVIWPYLLQKNILLILLEFTGFYVVLGQGAGMINPMGWFVGTIILLYLLFPFLARIVRKYQIAAMGAFMLISFATRYLILSGQVGTPDRFFLWFPLCNLFEFALGIYIAQNNLYLKNRENHPLISQLADLSFYVFLFHIIVIGVILPIFPKGGAPMFYVVWYLFMMLSVVIVSWLAMLADRRIQSWILNNERIKKVL